MKNNNHRDFEICLSQNLKLRFQDFSLGCIQEDVIIVKISATTLGKWCQIGKTSLSIYKNNIASWNDLEISHCMRGKGIGSNIVMQILAYLRKNQIKQVNGEISNVDDVKKVKHFWIRNGFRVVDYDKPKGRFIAKIFLEF